MLETTVVIFSDSCQVKNNDSLTHSMAAAKRINNDSSINVPFLIPLPALIENYRCLVLEMYQTNKLSFLVRLAAVIENLDCYF